MGQLGDPYWEFTQLEHETMDFPDSYEDGEPEREIGMTFATEQPTGGKYKELWKIERRLADEAHAEIARLSNRIRNNKLEELRGLVEGSHFKTGKPRHVDGCCICAKLEEIRECPLY
jgi:hypothetical protein